MTDKIILFVCKGNSGRSHMAEYILKRPTETSDATVSVQDESVAPELCLP
jgi:protein-tyrosine-phosphatase